MTLGAFLNGAITRNYGGIIHCLLLLEHMHKYKSTLLLLTMTQLAKQKKNTKGEECVVVKLMPFGVVGSLTILETDKEESEIKTQKNNLITLSMQGTAPPDATNSIVEVVV